MDSIRFFEAPDGFRWTYIAQNGNILADSGEAYADRRDATIGACRVIGFPPGMVFDRMITLTGLGHEDAPAMFPFAHGGRNIQMEVEW